MNESAADWGLVFDTLLLIAFLQSDAETPEAAAEKFVKKLLDIPENVDILAETPEERRARSAKWYAQEWAKALGIEVGDEGIKGPPGALGGDPRGEKHDG